ncbi:MAG: hypothetical protein QXW06_00010 [Thermoplasmata archaeon]
MKESFKGLKYAKSLEKKLAGDPTRRRRLQDELAKMGGRVEEARKEGANTSRLEGLLREAEAALERKEFDRVEELLTECEEILRSFRARTVEEELSLAGSIIDDIERLGVDASRIMELKVQAEEKVRKDPDEARRLAQTAIKEGARVLEAGVAEWLSNSESIVNDSERWGMDVSSFRASLEKVRGLIAKRAFIQAVEIMNSLYEEVERQRRAHFRELMTKVTKALEEARAQGMDVSRWEASLPRVGSLIDVRDYETVYELLKGFESDAASFTKKTADVGETLRTVAGLIERVEASGIPVAEQRAELVRLQGMAAAGKAGPALEAAVELRVALESLLRRRDEAAGELSKARELVEGSRKMGLDTSDALSKLNEAEERLRGGKPEEALSLARKVIDSQISSQRRVVAEVLESVQGELDALKATGASVEAPEETLRRARTASEAGRYAEAFLLARQSLGEIEARTGLIAQGVSRALALLEGAELEGPPLENAESLALEALRIVESGDAVQISEAAAALEKAVATHSRASVLAQDVLEKAQEAVTEALMAELDVSPESSKLEQARLAYESGDYEGARYRAEDIIPSLRQKCRDALEKTLRSTRNLIDEYGQQGAELPRAEEYLRRARELLECGRFGASHYYAGLAAEEARTLGLRFREAVDGRALLEATLERARGAGVEVGEFEESLAHVRALIENGQYESALTLSAEAVEAIEKKLEKQAHELCERLSALIEASEQLGLSVESEKTGLAKVRELLERGDIASAASSAREVLGLLEQKRLMHHTASETIQAAERRLSEAEAYGIPHSEMVEEMIEARKAFNSGNYEDAVSISHAVLDAAERLLSERSRAVLEAAMGRLEEAGSSGVVVKDLRERLEALRESVPAGAFLKVLREVQAVDAELARLKNRHSEALSALSRLQSRIAEAKGLGTDASSAEDLLGLARFASERGNYDDVLDYVRRGELELDGAIGDALRKRLEVIRARAEELSGEGVELSSLKKALRDLEPMLTERRFKEALQQLDRIETELGVRRDQHRNTQKLLTAVEARISEAAGMGVKTLEAQELLARARKSAESGDYPGAVELAEQARDTIVRSIESHQQTLGAIELARAHIRDAEAMGADIARGRELLEQAEAHFAGRNYDAAMEKVVEAEQELVRAQETLVQEWTSKARRAIDSAVEIGADAARAKDLLSQAEGAMQAREFEEAFALARRACEEAEASRERHAAGLSALTELQKLVQGAQSEGIRMEAFIEELERVRGLVQKHDYSSAMEVVSDCRRRAEETIAVAVAARRVIEGCESSLKTAREIRADVQHPETLLKFARKAFREGDYEQARARAEACLSQLVTAQRDVVWSELAPLLDELEVVAEEGADVSAAGSSLDEAGEALEAGQFKTSIELCRQARERLGAADSAFRESNSAVLLARAAVEEARIVEVDVTVASEFLNGSMGALSKHDYAGARELARQAVEEAIRGARAIFSQHIATAEKAIAEAENWGIRSRMARDRLARAKAAIELASFMDASVLLEECDGALTKAINDHRVVSERMGQLTEALERATALGVDVGRAREAAARAEALVSRGEYTRAIESYDKILADLSAAEREHVLGFIQRVRKAAEEAAAQGLETARELALLTEASAALEKGELQRAFELSSSASRGLESSRKEHRRIQGLAVALDEAVKKVKGYGADTSEPERHLAAARELLKKGAYAEAEDLINKGNQLLSRVQSQFMSQRLLKVEESLGYLEAEGVKAPKAIELHREAERLFRSQYYAEMLKTIEACEAEIKRVRKAREEMEAALSALNTILSAMDALGADPRRVQGFILRAKEVAGEGDYSTALSLLDEAKVGAEQGIRARVQEFLHSAATSIDEAEAIGANARAARQLLSEARALAEAGEHKRAVELAKATSEEAEKRAAEHRQHLEFVASAEKAVIEGEAEGLNMERFRSALEDARARLKSHDYQECAAAAERIKSEIGTLMRQSSEARRIIAFCEKKIGAARKIGAEVGSAEALLAEARAETERRNFVKAFEIATRCLKDLDSMQQAVVLGSLSDAELHIAEIEETGSDTAEASELLEVALEALNENEFEKSMELTRHALELARSKRAEHEASAESLKRLELSVKDFSEVGGDVRAIEELLESGRRALASHDHKKVEEIVRSGREALNVILQDFVSQNTRQASSFLSEIEEMGASVAKARDRLSRARAALECGDHKSALALIEESIHAAEEARRRHVETIEAVKGLQAMAREASELGLDISRTKKALVEVNEAVDEGRYDDASRIIQEARSELEKGYLRYAEEAVLKTEEWMRRSRELGAQLSAEERLLAETKVLFSQGRFQQVLKMCRECQRRAEERVNEHVASEILKAEHLISELERTGAAFGDFRAMLERSEEAVSEGNYDGALKLARETYARARDTLRSSVSGTLETLKGLVEESKKMGADVREAEEVLRLATTALRNEEFSSAQEQALSGIALVDRIREDYLSRKISMVERKIRESEEMGVVVEDLLKSLEMAREMLERAEFERASGLLAEVEKTAMGRQAAFAEEVIKKAEETLSKIKMDIDLTKPRSLIEEARAALSEGEYEEAMDYANRSIEEAGRAQRQFVEEVISTAEETIDATREMGADPKKAVEALEWARGDLEAGNFEAALEKAVQSAEEAERAQHEFVAGPIEYCRKVLKEARIQDERLRKLLASAEKLLAEKDYAAARREVLRALGLTEEVQEKLALKEISAAEEVLAKAEEAGAKSPAARNLLTGALKALDARDFEKATRLARECASQASRNREDFGKAGLELETATQKAALLKELGLAPEELLDFLELASAEFSSGNYTKTRDFVAQAMQLAERTYVKAASEAIASSQFKINYAKNIGADVSAAEHTLAEAKKAQEAKDFGRALELARKCGQEAEQAKERFKELVDTIYSAESMISVAKTYGLDTTIARRLLDQAVALRSTSGEEALDFARQSIEEVQRSLDRFTPSIGVEIKLEGQLHKERWSQASLSITNLGKATAKDVVVKFSGELDIQGNERIPLLRPGETRKQVVRVRPSKGGELPLTMSIAFLREFDGKEFSLHETRWIRVEDMTPLATPMNQFVTKAVRCHICLGTIKSGLPLVRCECGKTYHETCASRVGECPNCGRDLKNIIHKET